WTEVLAVPSGVLPLLIGHPLPPLRFLACGEGLPLAPNAGLLVMLALLELRQEPGLLTLLFEALQRALEGLVGLNDDLGHSAPPSAESQARWINVNYIPWRARTHILLNLRDTEAQDKADFGRESRPAATAKPPTASSGVTAGRRPHAAQRGSSANSDDVLQARSPERPDPQRPGPAAPQT